MNERTTNITVLRRGNVASVFGRREKVLIWFLNKSTSSIHNYGLRTETDTTICVYGTARSLTIYTFRTTEYTRKITQRSRAGFNKLIVRPTVHKEFDY